MATDILVIAEHEDGKLDSVTFELIGKGRELSDKLGGRLGVLILGVKLDPLVAELSDKGPDVVITIDNARLEPYAPEGQNNNSPGYTPGKGSTPTPLARARGKGEYFYPRDFVRGYYY